MSEDDDFFRDNPADIVLPHQPAVAVYTSVANMVVVRQERGEYQDADQIVVVQHANVVAVCLAMLREAGLDYVLTPRRTDPPALPAPAKDPTGAERQRRYRASRRDGVTRDGVTDDRDDVLLPFQQAAE